MVDGSITISARRDLTMQASDTPTPPPEQPTPEQQPPAGAAAVEEEKAGGGWRALGVLLALALAFACAVMIIAMVEISDTPLLDECRSDPTCTEYFDGSSGQKTIAVILGFVSGALAGVGALVALYFAATGRHGRLLLQVTGAAIAFGAVSLLIGSI
jgi:hypothetical protein